jgi:hypothetical protein
MTSLEVLMRISALLILAVLVVLGSLEAKHAAPNVVFAQVAPSPSPRPMCEGATPIPPGWVVTNEYGSPDCLYPGVNGRLLVIESIANAKKQGLPMLGGAGEFESNGSDGSVIVPETP